MKYEFNQYYYTAAPDLFNKSRKNGWGIFGSSTPDHNIENERTDFKRLGSDEAGGRKGFPN